MASAPDRDLNLVIEKIKDQLIRVPLLKMLAKSRHQTGANQDPNHVQQIYNFYCQAGDPQGKLVLELGPGQTWQVADLFCAAGAAGVIVCDIERYFTDDVFAGKNISFIQYSGQRLPLEEASLDMVCSFNVFEHLRWPEITVTEIFRVMKQGGMAIHSIDLRDHYFNLDSVQSFNCLKYSKSTWNSMTWHRSVYVNRLRASEWIRLHLDAGFSVCWARRYDNSLVRDAFDSGQLQYLSGLSEEDRFAHRLDLLVQKN